MERYHKRHLLDEDEKCDPYTDENGINKIKEASKLIVNRIENNQMMVKNMLLLYYLERDTLNPWLSGAENCCFLKSQNRCPSKLRNKSATSSVNSRPKSKYSHFDNFPLRNVLARSAYSKHKINVAFPVAKKTKLMIDSSFSRLNISTASIKVEAGPDSLLSQPMDFTSVSFISVTEEKKMHTKKKSYASLQPNINAFSEAKFIDKNVNRFVSQSRNLATRSSSQKSLKVLQEVLCCGDYCHIEISSNISSPMLNKTQKFMIPESLLNKPKISSFQNSKLKSFSFGNSLEESLKSALNTKKIGRIDVREVPVCINCYMKYTQKSWLIK